MNLGEIKTRVYRTFGDEAAVQITDPDIVRWVNDGQRKLVLENEGMLQATTTYNSVANQNNYAKPTDCMVLRAIRYKRTGELSFYKVDGKNLAEFDEFADGWDGTQYGSSSPSIYTVYQNEILLFPPPDESATGNIKVLYSRNPVDVANDSDEPDVPEIYHNALVYYCMSQAFMLDEDWNAAGNVAQAMQVDINKLKAHEDTGNNFEYYPHISVRFEDEW